MISYRSLNESFLSTITFLPEYEDPYHKRKMTFGEIGCFLSHYNIWKQIVNNNYEVSLILEDDVRFESYFRIKLLNIMEEAKNFDWDFIYLGRKKMQENDEPWIEGSTYLVEAGYSYWTLGYVLTLRGARKLLEAKPLSNLIPVDEYIPILFDRHPEESWKKYFPNRNLIAFSAAPLLLYPTHYTGQKGYVSDTEESTVVKLTKEEL